MSKRSQWILAGFIFFGGLIWILADYNSVTEEQTNIKAAISDGSHRSSAESAASNFAALISQSKLDEAAKYCTNDISKEHLSKLLIPKSYSIDSRTFTADRGAINVRDGDTVITQLKMVWKKDKWMIEDFK